MVADDLYNLIGQRVTELGVKGVEPRDLIDFIDGYQLGGHGCVNKELKGTPPTQSRESYRTLTPFRAGGLSGQ